MSSTSDSFHPEAAGANPGKSLVPYDPEAASASANAAMAASREPMFAQLRRFALPALLLVATGGMGWFAGAHSAMVSGRDAKAQTEAALATELKAHVGALAALAALEARMKAIESTTPKSAALNPAIDILAQRIDEIARRQTAGFAQTASRVDRSDKDMGARFDRINERMDRIEKQVSSSVPVGSALKNVSAVTRTAPLAVAAAAPKAVQPDVKALPGYVLRDVFRGGALIESRYGLIEVFPGVQLPGAGRVRSVEKRDGRWVVVTTAGVIETGN